MMDYSLIVCIFAAAIGVPGVSAAQDVEMNSTLSEGVAYNNQEIFFTCLVRDSNVLEWNSAEYIGQGGFPLQVSSFAGTDTNVSSTTRPSTYAVRRSVTTENDQSVIVSDLRIIASTRYPVATVSCGALSIRNITFQTLSSVMPPPATHDVTFNITTIQYVPATTMMATTTATTEDVTKVDGRRENQQSYTAGIACLAVFLIISLIVNTIVIILIITIIKVRCKGSPDRAFEAAEATSNKTGSLSETKNDNQVSGISPASNPESVSPKHAKKQKRTLLGELIDCMNLNKNVPMESEKLVLALKSLSDALNTGTPSTFKEAIKHLTDDLRVKKVPDEVLENSLENFRQTIQG